MGKEKAVLIENWSIGVDLGLQGEESLPPETRARLHGKVFGHPCFPDGTGVNTSAIIGYDPDADEVICQNRRYKLGVVDPVYEEKFPKARQRLIESWSKNEPSRVP